MIVEQVRDKAEVEDIMRGCDQMHRSFSLRRRRWRMRQLKAAMANPVKSLRTE